mmetsp:Transcript_47081/g.108799  ORF Transcript_47081/g.108799 Transcript_47081/m.108799 type:complete len:303 (-) Transcript_47081:1608-2516(-)
MARRLACCALALAKARGFAGMAPAAPTARGGCVSTKAFARALSTEGRVNVVLPSNTCTSTAASLPSGFEAFNSSARHGVACFSSTRAASLAASTPASVSGATLWAADCSEGSVADCCARREAATSAKSSSVGAAPPKAATTAADTTCSGSGSPGNSSSRAARRSAAGARLPRSTTRKQFDNMTTAEAVGCALTASSTCASEPNLLHQDGLQAASSGQNCGDAKSSAVGPTSASPASSSRCSCSVAAAVEALTGFTASGLTLAGSLHLARLALAVDASNMRLLPGSGVLGSLLLCCSGVFGSS